jgi:murein DD-endopeptidase MepM/ murein hydrolase activator NlpD
MGACAAAGASALRAPRPCSDSVDYQPGGAGFCAVGADDDTHWYVSMHCEAGSIVVCAGEPLNAGTRLGAVGATGDATGPHLHFEGWNGPWRAGGHPVAPLPLLQSLDR